MKKIICLVLCIIFVSTALVGCADDEIGADLDKYKDLYQEKVVEEMEFDLYIIVGDGTTDNAINTVELMINQHLEKFKTTLDIHYTPIDEYYDTVVDAAALEGDDRADIVLINSEELFNDLYLTHSLANITGYYDPISSAYRSMNTDIASSLLNAITVVEDSYNSIGTLYKSYNKYVVPNNHVVDSYDYVLILAEAAEHYNFGSLTVESTMYDEESVAELKNAIENDANATYNVDDCIKFVNGTYADKARFEKEGYICNIVTEPEVTSREAYSSAFGIVRHPLDERHNLSWDDEVSSSVIAEYTNYYDRCMEVIYEINKNEDLRNLLQYGKLGTNYKLDENGYVTFDGIAENDTYVMDILHTGNLFTAYYCEELGWTEDVAAYADLQNKASFAVSDITLYPDARFVLNMKLSSADVVVTSSDPEGVIATVSADYNTGNITVSAARETEGGVVTIVCSSASTSKIVAVYTVTVSVPTDDGVAS